MKAGKIQAAVYDPMTAQAGTLRQDIRVLRPSSVVDECMT